jgi:hypothetical protein
MPGFEYTPTNLTELERTLSRDRLAPYLTYVGGNQDRAIRLYEQNTALAEALYGILQGLEIALRNAIHEQMSHLGSGPGLPGQSMQTSGGTIWSKPLRGVLFSASTSIHA